MNTVRHLDLTVIMPVAPGANPRPAIKALTKAIPKGVSAELITVTGTHPTRQRNLAAFRAKGRILWFLDHDSIPMPETAERLLREFRNQEVAVVGGPNIAAPARTHFEQRSAAAIASWWGSPFVTDRYRSRGATRAATERSLILCNLMVRREPFMKAGGFDPRLYPNEENEFMNGLSAVDRHLLHVPAAFVLKPRARSLAGFLHEAFRYGTGRARQVWISRRIADLPIALLGAVTIVAVPAAGIWPQVFLPASLFAFTFLVLGDFAWRGHLAVADRRSAVPGLVRVASYCAGLASGLLTQWRWRSLRLKSLPAQFIRFHFRSGSFRISESSSFDLGSITMKGAFRHA